MLSSVSPTRVGLEITDLIKMNLEMSATMKTEICQLSVRWSNSTFDIHMAYNQTKLLEKNMAYNQTSPIIKDKNHGSSLKLLGCL